MHSHWKAEDGIIIGLYRRWKADDEIIIELHSYWKSEDEFSIAYLTEMLAILMWGRLWYSEKYVIVQFIFFLVVLLVLIILARNAFNHF